MRSAGIDSRRAALRTSIAGMTADRLRSAILEIGALFPAIPVTGVRLTRIGTEIRQKEGALDTMATHDTEHLRHEGVMILAHVTIYILPTLIWTAARFLFRDTNFTSLCTVYESETEVQRICLGYCTNAGEMDGGVYCAFCSFSRLDI
jgi:hypothetical protein